MKRKNTGIVKSTLAGLVLALSTTLTGACREPIPEKNPEPFKVKQCSIEADFGYMNVGSTNKLMEEESVQSWEGKGTLLFKDTTNSNNISHLMQGTYYIKDLNPGDTLEKVVNYPTNIRWVTMIINRGTTEMVTRIPDYYSKDDSIPELDTIYPMLTHPVPFDAQYKATFKDLQLIVSGTINKSDKILFLLDIAQQGTTLQTGQVPKITTKTMLTPQIAGIQADYLSHNKEVILYNMKKNPNVTPAPSIQEGIYTYDVVTNTSTFISVEGKDDKLLSLLEDRVLVQKKNGEIWQVSLKDFTKRQETGTGTLFLTTIKGHFMAYDTINIRGDNTYILYREGADPVTLQNTNNILLKNIDIPASYTSWNTGVALHSPKVFPLLEIGSGENLAYILLKQNSISKLLEFTGPEIKVRDIPGAPEGNDSTLDYVGSADYKFFVYEDSVKHLQIVQREWPASLSVGSIDIRGMRAGSFILPAFTIVQYSTDPNIPDYDFWPYDLSSPRILSEKRAKSIQKLLFENNLVIHQSFFEDNAILVQGKNPGKELYINIGTGELHRLDGTYSTSITKGTYEYEATLKTHPPRFLLHEKDFSAHKILVKPE